MILFVKLHPKKKIEILVKLDVRPKKKQTAKIITSSYSEKKIAFKISTGL